MRLNHRPSRVCFLDFETQSEQELTTVSKYVNHPSTRVLTCVVRKDGQEYRFGPYLHDESKELLARLTEGCTIVAHNAPFDAAVWDRVAGLPEREWFDTLPCARAAGFPGKLEDIGQILQGRGKDPNGRRLIDMLCIIRNGKYPAVGPAHQLLLNYNARDVELLEQIFPRVKDFGDPAVIQVDRDINDRGVPIDRQQLFRMRELYDENKEIQKLEFEELTGGLNPNSPKQVTGWLEQLGFPVAHIDKTTMKDLLSRPDDFFVGDSDFDAVVDLMKAALEARREVARVGGGKIARGIEALEDDDRIREQFVIYRAVPGRWAGRGIQLHNMPLAPKGLDVRSVVMTREGILEAAARATEASGERVCATDIINACLRTVVKCPMLVADYSSVEARCLAWVCRCGKMLDLYSDPRGSIYLDMGRALFGKPISKSDKQEYALSKAIVLGCGYGMSGAKFAKLCLSRNVSVSTLAKVGLKPEEAVKVYRRTYPEIPATWAECHETIHDVVNGGPSRETARCFFHLVGRDLHMVLPSGRPVVFRNARIEPRVPGYCKLYGMPEEPVDTVIYDKPYSKEGFLYGSKVCENICQGICADPLARTLVESQQMDLDPFLHVHDEVANCASESRLEEYLCSMSRSPDWAPDLPLMVEGHFDTVWCKGGKDRVALGGRMVE